MAPGKAQGTAQPREAQQPCSNLPGAVLLQILKLHGFDTLGKIWTIFSLTAASTSSLGYIYWILQATIHILRLNQCSFTTQIFTSVSPTGNVFCLQEPLNKSVFLTMIVQTLLIRVNYTHRFYSRIQIGQYWCSLLFSPLS